MIPYVLIGLLGAGSVVQSLTQGAFPEVFAATGGGVPPWISGLGICAVVLLYVFVGGLRAAAWANSLQAAIFIVTGIATFLLIASKLGGVEAATQAVQAAHPEKLIRGGAIGPMYFFSYCFIPLSIGMFPHVYQHWLTAKSAAAFKPMLVLHPVCMALVWLPCVLVGVWATAAVMPDGSAVVPPGSAVNSELAIMVQRLASPLMGGILGAGILAAIMSSLDSQFLAIGSMFTNDVVAQVLGKRRMSDAQKVRMGRMFVGAVAIAAYLASLSEPRSVFTLGGLVFQRLRVTVSDCSSRNLLEASNRRRRDRIGNRYGDSRVVLLPRQRLRQRPRLFVPEYAAGRHDGHRVDGRARCRFAADESPIPANTEQVLPDRAKSQRIR